jgi:hypothetical protein
VAVIAFAEGVLSDFPLTRGKARILSLMQFLEGLEPAGSDTSLSELVAAFVHRSQRRGLTIVISDLFDPHGYERGLDLLRHHRYEPSVIQLYDRLEAEPQMLGDIELQDVETQSIRKITVTEKNLRQYRTIFQNFLDSADEYCRRYSVGFTSSTCDRTFEELILQMMHRRGAVV